MHLAELDFIAMGPQPPFDTPAMEKFVADPRIGVLSYVKRDGSPAQAPIWYRYKGGRFEMFTSATSPKAKALARAGRACMSIQDDMPPYRAVIVDGTIEVAQANPDDELNEWLAFHYFGKIGGREFLKMSEEENAKTGVVKVTLDPTRVRGFDNHKVLSGPVRLFMRLRESVPGLRGLL